MARRLRRACVAGSVLERRLGADHSTVSSVEHWLCSVLERRLGADHSILPEWEAFKPSVLERRLGADHSTQNRRH